MAAEYADCPFCSMAPGRIIVENQQALAVRDAFPVTPGHTLVVSRRHVADYFALSSDEQTALWELVNRVRDHLSDEMQPDGYNLGVNVGAAAGQTIPHVHVHVIPRRSGDREEPRGGVRWIFPERAPYWQGREPEQGPPQDEAT